MDHELLDALFDRLPWWAPWANVLLWAPAAAAIIALALAVAAWIAGAQLRRAQKAATRS